MTSRRAFLSSALGFLAAPAIVRIGSLMPVKAIGTPFSFVAAASNSAQPIMDVTTEQIIVEIGGMFKPERFTFLWEGSEDGATFKPIWEYAPKIGDQPVSLPGTHRYVRARLTSGS